MSKKKTPWFPPNINPVHEGVYQIRTGSGFCYSHWDGERWAIMSSNAVAAEKVKGTTSWQQYRSWRGLTEKALLIAQETGSFDDLALNYETEKVIATVKAVIEAHCRGGAK